MLTIDNCKHCAALTHTNYENLDKLLKDIDAGDIGCWLCDEDGEHHTEFDIYEKDENGLNTKVWCGHTPQGEVDALSIV